MYRKPIMQKYSPGDVEYLVFYRFSTICRELHANLDPPTGARKSKAFQAAMPGLKAAAIAMLECSAIPEDDWPEYLEWAYTSGVTEVLQATLKAMPDGTRSEYLRGKLVDIVKVAPIEHLLLGAEAGIVEMTPSREVISAAISRNSCALKARIISDVAAGKPGLCLEDWFVGMRSDQMRKGAAFLGELLPVVVSRNPRDGANGLITSVDRKRGLHALVLHLAGARIEAPTGTAWDSLNNHRLLGLLGTCSTIEDLLSDPAAIYRAEDFLTP